MSKYTKICLLLSLFLFIYCHVPPSREIQNKDFTDLSSIIESSDRVLNLSYLDEKIEYSAEEENYISLKFEIVEKFIGSSKEGEIIFITFSKSYFDELTSQNKENISFSKENNYLFFLMGRAKKNTFPKKLGGSLWLNNGNPSIYEISDNKINIISNPLIIENLPEEFNNIQKISYSDFRKIILEKIIK